MALSTTKETNMIGYFTNTETDVRFEYDDDVQSVLAPPPHGGRNMVYPHRIHLESEKASGHGQGWRHALVMGTRAYVITDEREEDGRTWWVVECWKIKKHRKL
jgi:hypothetical protein